jgi:anti-sigma B factor antagonist
VEVNGRVEGPEVMVISLGEDNLDASNVREFKAAVQSLIVDHRRVVLDMTGVRFVDSSGLGALISCLRLVNGQQGDFRLCALSSVVKSLFEMMRMNRVFKIHETRSDAVHSFA